MPDVKERGIFMKKCNWLELLNMEMGLSQIQQTNQYTKEYGLELSKEDTELLLAKKNETLRLERRVEFGEGILPKIIYYFCDSQYIYQENYVETLVRLQEIFFSYKNEMLDEINDEELLQFMREQFDDVCFGDLDYLEGTCLDIFAQAIRAGYGEYTITGGKGEFARLDLVQRWDKELYIQALEHLQ